MWNHDEKKKFNIRVCNIFFKKEIDLKQKFTIIFYGLCISYKRNHFRYETSNTLDNIII